MGDQSAPDRTALARPYLGYHRSIAAKAAVVHSTVGNRGFVDANKRTAWLLVEILVDRSGYRLDIPDDEPVDDLIVSVATGFQDLVRWFQERLVRA